MWIVPKAKCPGKHKVLPLCNGDTQEASFLSGIRGLGDISCSHFFLLFCFCFFVVDKNPLHVAINISTPVSSSSEKNKYLLVYIFWMVEYFQMRSIMNKYFFWFKFETGFFSFFYCKIVSQNTQTSISKFHSRVNFWISWINALL